MRAVDKKKYKKIIRSLKNTNNKLQNKLNSFENLPAPCPKCGRRIESINKRGIDLDPTLIEDAATILNNHHAMQNHMNQFVVIEGTNSGPPTHFLFL